MKHTLEEFRQFAKSSSDVGTLIFNLQIQIDTLKKRKFLNRADGDAILEATGKALGSLEKDIDKKLDEIDGSALYKSVTLALFDQRVAALKTVLVAQKHEKAAGHTTNCVLREVLS